MAGPTPISDATLDAELSAALRGRGHRVTLPRLLVHRHLRRREGHVTAEQLHSELAPQMPSLSPATIYGTLDLLDELGFVRRVSTPRGRTVYDPRVAPHHHVICRGCGRLQDLDAGVAPAAAELAARQAGFSVDYGQLQITGVCEDCRRIGTVATA